MGTVYVTGHRNPDTDSIASAIGYAELKRRLDPNNRYVPVRLGELNAQTQWVLDRGKTGPGAGWGAGPPPPRASSPAPPSPAGTSVRAVRSRASRKRPRRCT